MSQTSSLELLSDEELVRLCLARGTKDERPFQELFRRYQGAIWWTCYNFARSPEEAESLTQEVFFKAYRSLPQFQNLSPFKTWIYEIAINICQGLTPSPPPSVAKKGTSPADETVLSEIAHRLAENLDQQKLLTQIVSQLQPDEYEILRLKDLEQRSYAEIADLLGISLNAAKIRVLQARLSLQTAYQQLGKDATP